MRVRLYRALSALLAVLGLLLLLPRPASAAGAIRLSASPNVLLADGISTTTITAEVRMGSGRPARDGTEVRFYTTAGTITAAAFTSAGVARATLKSSSIPQAANVSVAVGVDQAVIVVPMVSKVVEASVGGRVMRITAGYVAYSEDKRFIQADNQVKLRFRGVEIEANSVQLDVTGENVKALGKVQIASGDKTLVGERLWLDLKTFEGYILAVRVRKWFSAYGLTELPERPRNQNPDFDLVDLSDSKVMWVGKSADYIVGERVQLQNARAYVGGIKTLRMPFHKSNLQAGFDQTEQYVGFGTEGVSVDIPFYLRMSPDSATALRFGYGSRSGGIGNFTRNQGLSLDLVQSYGFAGASEGQAALTNMSSFDKWGFAWNHNQQITKTTRLAADIQFPEHRDIYVGTHLTSGMPIGTFSASMNAAKNRYSAGFAKTMSLGFETKPKPVASGLLALSAVAGFYRRDAQELRISRGLAGTRGLRVPVAESQYQSLGLKIGARPANLGKGLSLNSSATLQGISGSSRNGFGPALETSLQKTLPNNGLVSFGLSYNHLASVTDLLPTTGRTNATLNLTYPVSSRFRLLAIGSMGLDSPNTHSIFQASYNLNQKWRLDLLHSMFQFGGFNDFDFQVGIARAIGNRELGLYWSRREGRFIVEFGAARF